LFRIEATLLKMLTLIIAFVILNVCNGFIPSSLRLSISQNKAIFSITRIPPLALGGHIYHIDYTLTKTITKQRTILYSSSSDSPSSPSSSSPDEWSERLSSLEVSEVRSELISKYLEIGRTREFAEGEVDTFLQDRERSEKFLDMRRIAKEAEIGEREGWSKETATQQAVLYLTTFHSSLLSSPLLAPGAFSPVVGLQLGKAKRGAKDGRNEATTVYCYSTITNNLELVAPLLARFTHLRSRLCPRSSPERCIKVLGRLLHGVPTSFLPRFPPSVLQPSLNAQG